MRSAILAFAAGVWALQAQAELPDWSRLAVLAGVGLALGAAFLNAAFGFCLGCEMYLIGRRLLPARADTSIATRSPLAEEATA